METLTFALDWRQILNSVIGSVIAFLIVAPCTIVAVRWLARFANRYRFGLGVVVTLLGIFLFGVLVGPSLYREYQTDRYFSSILSQARRWGGDEPQPRVAFTCAEICETEISLASGLCLDTRVQFSAEHVAEYGYRNRAGLRMFLVCMQNYGYSANHCEVDLSNCVSVPDIGYRTPSSSIYYSAECTSTEINGIVCEYVGRYE